MEGANENVDYNRNKILMTMVTQSWRGVDGWCMEGPENHSYLLFSLDFSRFIWNVALATFQTLMKVARPVPTNETVRIGESPDELGNVGKMWDGEMVNGCTELQS